MSTSVLARPRRRLAVGACAGALALGLAACGGSSNKDADPAEAVPAGVPVYVEATVQPGGELKTNVENVSKRLFGTSDVAAEIDKQLQSSSGDSQLGKTITSWVGSQAGLFVNGFSAGSADAALVAAIGDKSAAEKALDEDAKSATKKSYKDVAYYVDKDDPTTVTSIVDDYVVAGTERAVKIVIDTVKGDGVEKIGDSQKYQDAIEAVGDPADALATVYASPQGLIDALARSGGIPSSALAGVRQSLTQAGSTWAAKLGVSNNAVALDFAATGVKERTGAAAAAGQATKALQALPGDAWVGIGLGGLGEQLRTALQQGLQAASATGQDVQGQLQAIEQQLGISIDDDLLSWMGDAGLFAQGTSVANIGGALVITTDDPTKAKAAITKLTRLLRQTAPNVEVRPISGVRGADTGVQVLNTGAPFPIIAAVGSGKFVLGVGQQAVETALSPSSTLADSSAFKQAAAALDGVDPTFFLDFGPVAQLLQGAGLAGEPDGAKVLQAVQKLGSLSAGSEMSGTTVRGKLVLTLPE